MQYIQEETGQSARAASYRSQYQAYAKLFENLWQCLVAHGE